MRFGTFPIPNVGPHFGTRVVTPSVHDENYTLWQQLNQLQIDIEKILVFANGFEDEAEGMVAQFTEQLETTVETLRELVETNRDDLESMIVDAYPSGVAENPTTGALSDPVSKVISNVFDNSRVFAYFADQYDELELTAEDYDNLDLTARQYDLAPDYRATNHSIYEAPGA